MEERRWRSHVEWKRRRRLMFLRWRW